MTLALLLVIGALLVGVEACRLRVALHVFQLEGYKRARFLKWCRANPRRALFVTRSEVKKPLVMTGRAARLLGAAAAFAVLALILVPAAAWLAIGPGAGGVALLLLGAVVGVLTPHLLVLADVLLGPVQQSINAGFLRAAQAKLAVVDPMVIGVTGSFGKTSTKFAIERLAAPEGDVLATPGSFNTPLGVCRTINEKLEARHRYFVVEMGAYGRGEIAELCELTHPRVGVLTAIGPAHLERFGSMEAIRRAKYEIVMSLPEGGVAVMNVDDQEVRALAEQTSDVQVVRYGIDGSGRPDVTASGLEVTSSGTSFIVHSGGETLQVDTVLLGRHAIGHVLGGVAVARSLGRPLVDLKAPIESLEPVEHRLQLIAGESGVTVIDDAYNSNPSGAAAALDVLGAMPGERKVVVTPGMVELGDLQEEANRAFGEHAGRVADTLIVVGRLNRDALVRGGRSGSAEIVPVDSLAEATARLRSLLRPGDVVLFENDLPDQYEN